MNEPYGKSIKRVSVSDGLLISLRTSATRREETTTHRVGQNLRNSGYRQKNWIDEMFIFVQILMVN